MLKDVKKEIIKAIAVATKLPPHDISSLIETPKAPELGDFAFPCFKLATKLKKDPKIIASDIKSKLPKLKLIKKVEVVGPYLNFFIDMEVLADNVLKEAIKLDYGFSKAKRGKVIVEFISPNTNKPLSLGHLRNAALGESISRILEANGFKVIRACLYNDRGIHICKSMLAYQKWGSGKTPKSENVKGDHFVGDFYVLFNKKAGEDLKLNDEAQEMLRKWESGDRKTLELWSKLNQWVLDGFKETYKNFGIKFDKEYFESEHYKKAKDLILQFYKKKFFKKDKEGNIIAELGKFGLPDKVVLRADGTSVYITQDIMLAKMKYDEFKPEISLYVVGDEQNLHFQQLFAILKLLNIKAGQYYHLSYGMVNLPSGKMKSREGTVVDADDLMQELQNIVKIEIETRHNHEFTDKKMAELSRKISLAALKYYLLKFDPKTTMTFDPKQSIALEGDTGPYIQYALVRAKKILEKVKAKGKIKAKLLKLPEEIALIKHIAKFPLIVEKAGQSYQPHLIAIYARELADLFNTFYEKAPVMKANKELRNARLYLVDAIRHTLQKALSLLGIEEVEVM
ncbi:MAG: arginine--tRNA ligase [Candidatus Nanoarchaeia archaeon]